MYFVCFYFFAYFSTFCTILQFLYSMDIISILYCKPTVLYAQKRYILSHLTRDGWNMTYHHLNKYQNHHSKAIIIRTHPPVTVVVVAVAVVVAVVVCNISFKSELNHGMLYSYWYCMLMPMPMLIQMLLPLSMLYFYTLCRYHILIRYRHIPISFRMYILLILKLQI